MDSSITAPDPLSTVPVSNIKKSSKGYLPQLDSIRAFLIFGVLLSHFAGENFASAGIIAIIFFFVLSGFLITQILLKSRYRDDLSGTSRVHSIKQFYVRRFLRIFPIYYILLAVLFTVNFQTTRHDIFWYLTYTSNILYYINNNFMGLLSHTWSLSVEEQFYILWPFFMFFLPRKYLLPVMIAAIVTAPIFRAILYSNYLATGDSFLLTVLTPSCMDAFGLGGILAYFRLENKEAFSFKSILSKVFLIICLIFFVMLMIPDGILSNILSSFINFGIVQLFFIRLLIAVFAFYVIAKASIGFKGVLKIILESSALRFIGKISYGMYLYHPFMYVIYKKLGLPMFSNVFITFCIYSSMTIIVSTLSWYIIEKPLNGLKKYFAYD
ncbi:MAG: acyltransferase [Ignavibacteria bacterium]